MVNKPLRGKESGFSECATTLQMIAGESIKAKLSQMIGKSMLSKLFGGKGKRSAPAGSVGRYHPDIMQQIGFATIAAAQDGSGRLLLYSEVEAGVISADVFSQEGNGAVHFRFAPHHLKSLIYASWETLPESERWATMTYTIDNGRIKCAFAYPDTLKLNDDIHDRRSKAVEAFFGGAKVDYSAPN